MALPSPLVQACMHCSPVAARACCIDAGSVHFQDLNLTSSPASQDREDLKRLERAFAACMKLVLACKEKTACVASSLVYRTSK